MRRVAALLILVLCAPACGCTFSGMPALTPAPTPSEALERSTRARIDADEHAYRRITLIRSPARYSEAYTRWEFASFRLNQAVRDHGVTGTRVREAGWDCNQTLSPNVTEPVDAEQAGKWLQA